MKKFSSKALLGALSTIGTIAAFGITTSTAHASVVSAGTANIPQELVSGGGAIIASNTSNPIVYTPTAALNGNSVVVNVSNGSLTTLASASYNLVGTGGTACSGTTSGGPSITLSSCTLNANSSYTLAVVATSGTTPYTSFTASGGSLVVSISSLAGVGSATLFTATPELSFATPSSSTYTIDTSQTIFTNDSSSTATNSISMKDNYNNVSWLGSGYIQKGTINFVFSGIPSSVTSVSGGLLGSNGNITGLGSTTNIVTNSATIGASISVVNPPSVGSATFSFTFSNSGNIATGTIDVAVNGSSLSGAASVANVSGSLGSYTWLNTTPFITFTNLTASVYGELVYLNSAAMQTYNEELRLILPSGISASNVSISLAGNSCGNLSQYVSSSVSGSNQTTYSLNVSGLLTASCISGNSYNNGDLVPVQITLPATANISQVSGVAFAWGNNIYKRLPLNVVQGQATHLTY